MRINGIELNKKSTVFFVLNCVILASFVFLPWISVVGVTSPSIVTISIKVLSAILSAFSDTWTAYIMRAFLQEYFVYVLLLVLYIISWYSMPVAIISSFRPLFKKENVDQFDLLSVRALYTSLGNAVLFFLVRFIILSSITNSLGTFLGYASGGALKLGFGFYVILFCSLAGVIVYYYKGADNSSETVLGTSKAGKAINDTMQNLVNQGKDFIEKQQKSTAENTTAAKNTTESAPVMTLTGNNEEIKIQELPSTIGRNKDEVDYYLSDESISRQHLELQSYEDKILIRDLGSTLGTLLNGSRLEPDEYFQILDQDVLTLGNIEYVVTINQTQVQPVPVAQPEENYYDKTVAQYDDLFLNTADEEATVGLSEPESEEGQFYEEVVPSFNSGEETVLLANPSGKREMAFPVMVLQRKDDESEVYLINKSPFTVGKNSEASDLAIDVVGLSKKHFIIEHKDGGFVIRDLNSTNGTQLNGENLIPEQEYSIYPNDIITIANQEYRFEEA